MPSTLQPKFLGRTTPLPGNPAEALLDQVANPHPSTLYVARFTFPEFTALCPVTGQPDFAIIVIDYCPGDWLVESKSLKLYLNAFRNHGALHEDCVVSIGKRMDVALKPLWLRVSGYFNPRGGMPIDVFFESGELPGGCHVPPHDIALYKGR